jgi:hypothetical protein
MGGAAWNADARSDLVGSISEPNYKEPFFTSAKAETHSRIQMDTCLRRYDERSGLIRRYSSIEQFLTVTPAKAGVHPPFLTQD